MRSSFINPSSQDIHIDGMQLVSDNPHVLLDFGGIAKGYAVDLAIERIRGHGYQQRNCKCRWRTCERWDTTAKRPLARSRQENPAAASSVPLKS